MSVEVPYKTRQERKRLGSISSKVGWSQGFASEWAWKHPGERGRQTYQRLQ